MTKKYKEITKKIKTCACWCVCVLIICLSHIDVYVFKEVFIVMDIYLFFTSKLIRHYFLPISLKLEPAFKRDILAQHVYSTPTLWGCPRNECYIAS